jgi:hypothetical protein
MQARIQAQTSRARLQVNQETKRKTSKQRPSKIKQRKSQVKIKYLSQKSEISWNCAQTPHNFEPLFLSVMRRGPPWPAYVLSARGFGEPTNIK